MGSILHYSSQSLRRLKYVTRLAARGFASLTTDVRLLARQANGSAVFRQATIDGFQMLVRANEDVGRQIFCLQSFEPEESAYLRESIRSGDRCVDVGANVGYYTLLLAALAKEGEGQVHSFEPVPLNYHLLQSNVIINGCKNVVVNCCALGDSDTEVDFGIAQDSAFSSLVDTGRRPIVAKIRVPMMTLDHYCERHVIGKVDFLKVDVEGAEERVLRGAMGLLSNPIRRPRLILLELYEPMLCQHGSGIDSILKRMGRFGYQPFIRQKGSTVPFAQQHQNVFYNVFFSPTDSPVAS